MRLMARAARRGMFRTAVYARDKWTCQYCGRVIPPNNDDCRRGRYAPWERKESDPDVVVLELDHVVPRKLGGDDSIENLRAACTPCNKRKLATTRHTKWDRRIKLALDVLECGPHTEETAMKAAALLIGCLQRELPKPRGAREAGF